MTNVQMYKRRTVYTQVSVGQKPNLLEVSSERHLRVSEVDVVCVVHYSSVISHHRGIITQLLRLLCS
jgi:hypothetical protein